MVTVKNAGQFRMEIQNERELTHTDVPAEQGGVGEYPTPVVLFAQSLMACALTTASMGAVKEDVDTTGWYAELKEIGFDAAHSVVERIAIHSILARTCPRRSANAMRLSPIAVVRWATRSTRRRSSPSNMTCSL